MKDFTPAGHGPKMVPVSKSIERLNTAIEEITMTIRNQYPQLIPYLNVASVANMNTQTQDLEASTKKDYLDMLTLALQKYKEKHQKDKNGNAKVKTGAPD